MDPLPGESPRPAQRCASCAAAVAPPPNSICTACDWSLDDAQVPTAATLQRWAQAFWILPGVSLVMILPGFAAEGSLALFSRALAWLPLAMWCGLGPRTGPARLATIGVAGLGAAASLIPTAAGSVFASSLVMWLLVVVYAFVPTRLWPSANDLAPRLIAFGRILRFWAVVLAAYAVISAGAIVVAEVSPAPSPAGGSLSGRAWPHGPWSPLVSYGIDGRVDVPMSGMRCLASGFFAWMFWRLGSQQLRRGQLAARLPPT